MKKPVPLRDHGPFRVSIASATRLSQEDPCLHAVVSPRGPRVAGASICKPLPHVLLRFACLREAASAMAGHAGVAFPACIAGPGYQPIPVGRRPTIARGLALSEMIRLLL